jgi:small subunit ribosomal protein S9
MADENDIPVPDDAEQAREQDAAQAAADTEGPQGQVEEAAAEEAVVAEASGEEAAAQEKSEQEEAPAEPVPEAPAEQAPAPVAQEAADSGQADAATGAETDEEEEPAPRAKPSVPGAHLEVDIVPEGEDPLGRDEQQYEDPYALELSEESGEDAVSDEAEPAEEPLSEPIATAAIDLAAGARYRATGKRKTAIARVTLRPGKGEYSINGRPLEVHFPRATLQRNVRQPLEAVGYQERMDVVARLHGGGISAQAGALRHGVSRALLEADPNLRGELKRRGFLTRDSRAKERKKAGLKKARKRPQFSKR